MRVIHAVLAMGLLAASPAFGQATAHQEAMRALNSAESELRDTLRRLDEGGLPGSMGVSRMRQALNEVERAMLRLPANAREGPAWQAAVQQVSEAMAALREDSGATPEKAREAAGEALSTIPALRGEETGSSGG
jgi:predicted ATPase